MLCIHMESSYFDGDSNVFSEKYLKHSEAAGWGLLIAYPLPVTEAADLVLLVLLFRRARLHSTRFSKFFTG